VLDCGVAALGFVLDLDVVVVGVVGVAAVDAVEPVVVATATVVAAGSACAADSVATSATSPVVRARPAALAVAATIRDLQVRRQRAFAAAFIWSSFQFSPVCMQHLERR
jgi:hypothetical protein